MGSRGEQSRAEQSRAEQSRAEQSRAGVLFLLILAGVVACGSPDGAAGTTEALTRDDLAAVSVDEARVAGIAVDIENELAELDTGAARRVARSEALDREVRRLATGREMDLATLRATAAALRARTYAGAVADELPTGPFLATDEDRRLARLIDPEFARTRAVDPPPMSDFITPETVGVATAPPVLSEACTAEASDAR